MLTQAQIRKAKTSELKKLKRRIEAELESRHKEATREHHGRQALQTKSSASGTYQWELVECGHKDRCNKCKSGKKHGPYLYRYSYKNGKYTSEYDRLKDLDKHPDAPPRPAPLQK